MWWTRLKNMLNPDFELLGSQADRMAIWYGPYQKIPNRIYLDQHNIQGCGWLFFKTCQEFADSGSWLGTVDRWSFWPLWPFHVDLRRESFFFLGLFFRIWFCWSHIKAEFSLSGLSGRVKLSENPDLLVNWSLIFPIAIWRTEIIDILSWWAVSCIDHLSLQF